MGLGGGATVAIAVANGMGVSIAVAAGAGISIGVDVGGTRVDAAVRVGRGKGVIKTTVFLGCTVSASDGVIGCAVAVGWSVGVVVG